VQHWWAFTGRRNKESRRPSQTLYVSAEDLPTPAVAARFFKSYFQHLDLPSAGKVSRASALPINTTRLVVFENQQIFGERLQLLGIYPPPSKPGDWV